MTKIKRSQFRLTPGQQVLHLHQAEAEEFLSHLAELERGHLPAGAERLKANFGKVNLPVGETFSPQEADRSGVKH